MLQFSERLASKGIKVTLTITAEIGKFIHASQASSINVEPIFDGSKEEGEISANIDKYFENYKATVPRSLAELIDGYNGTQCPVKFLTYDSVIPWALDVATDKPIEGGPFFTQNCAATAVLCHVVQGEIEVPPEGFAVVSLPSLAQLEFCDLPSFVRDLGSYPAICDLLLGHFSNFKEGSWSIWNTFNELEHL